MLTAVPHGWPVRLIECPPGLFSYDGEIGFKSEYFTNDPERMEVFFAESGEVFWGFATDKASRARLIVQPCVLERRET